VILAFAAMATWLGIGSTVTAWDRTAFLAVNNGLACPTLDVVMPLVTDLGLGHVQVIALLGAALVLAAHRGEFRTVVGARFIAPQAPLFTAVRMGLMRRRHWLFPALAAVVMTGVVVQIPKRMHRQRPSWFYVNEQRAGRCMDVRVHTIEGRRPLRVNGFPSGHTATTAAIAVVLGACLPRRRGYGAVVACVWILTPAIGLSRVYMADHWPLDVLGGVALGSMCGFAAALPRLRRPKA